MYASRTNDCTRSLADCAGLPYLTVRLDNADGLVQWEACKLTLRLVNQGRASIQQEIGLALGGGFVELVEARVLGDLAPRATWRVPLLAPATLAAAIPLRTIKAPKNKGCFTVCWAVAKSNPLCLRSSKRVWLNASPAGSVAGSRLETPLRSTPSLAAVARMVSGWPSRIGMTR